MEADKRGLTGAQLKYLGCVLMVIDHIGLLFAPMAQVADFDELLFHLFRYPGRLVFPIFAFFLAEGCTRTRHFRRYLLRLGLFGAITHVVALAATEGENGSVIATFFLAALGIRCYQLLRGRGLAAAPALLPAVGLACLGQTVHVDYGWMGVATVVALYLCGRDQTRRLVCLAIAMALLYLVQFPLEWALSQRVWDNFGAYLPLLRDFYAPYWSLCLVCAWASLPLLARYNGQPGRGNQWFFYCFYPAHMAVLYLLSLLIS